MAPERFKMEDHYEVLWTGKEARLHDLKAQDKRLQGWLLTYRIRQDRVNERTNMTVLMTGTRVTSVLMARCSAGAGHTVIGLENYLYEGCTLGLPTET